MSRSNATDQRSSSRSSTGAVSDERPLPPLRLAPATMRTLGYRAVDAIVDRLAGLSERPVARRWPPGELADRLRETVPSAPTDPAHVLELMQPVGGRPNADAATLVEVDREALLLIERSVQLDRAAEELHQVVALDELRAEAGGMPRRPARELVRLNERDVAPAEPGEVVEVETPPMPPPTTTTRASAIMGGSRHRARQRCRGSGARPDA